jgi:hypothetical protein
MPVQSFRSVVSFSFVPMHSVILLCVPIFTTTQPQQPTTNAAHCRTDLAPAYQPFAQPCFGLSAIRPRFATPPQLSLADLHHHHHHHFPALQPFARDSPRVILPSQSMLCPHRHVPSRQFQLILCSTAVDPLSLTVSLLISRGCLAHFSPAVPSRYRHVLTSPHPHSVHPDDSTPARPRLRSDICTSRGHSHQGTIRHHLSRISLRFSFSLVQSAPPSPYCLHPIIIATTTRCYPRRSTTVILFLPSLHFAASPALLCSRRIRTPGSSCLHLARSVVVVFPSLRFSFSLVQTHRHHRTALTLPARSPPPVAIPAIRPL